MATIQHPTFPDVQQDVPDKDLADWLEQGWLSVLDSGAGYLSTGETVIKNDTGKLEPLNQPKPGPRNK